MRMLVQFDTFQNITSDQKSRIQIFQLWCTQQLNKTTPVRRCVSIVVKIVYW